MLVQKSKKFSHLTKKKMRNVLTETLSIHAQVKPQLEGREKLSKFAKVVVFAKNIKILLLILICSRKLKVLSIHARMKPQLEG